MKYFFLLCMFLFMAIKSEAQINSTEIDTSLVEKSDYQMKIYARANHLFEKQEFKEALSLYESVYNDMEGQYLLFKVGLCKYYTGDYNGAIQELTKSLRITPKEAIKNNLQFMEEEILLYIEGSDSYIETPQYISLRHLAADAFIYRGHSKLIVNDYYGAVNDIKSYHKYSKDSTANSCLLLGEGFFGTKQYQKAKVYFSKAIQMAEKSDNSNVLRDAYLYRGLGNYMLKQPIDRCCIDFSKALELGSEKARKCINDFCR